MACGSAANLEEIPGLAARGYPLKTVTDAIVMGNDLIGNFEAAATEPEPEARQRLDFFHAVQHLAAVGRADVEVLQPDAGLSHERGEGAEPQGVADDGAIGGDGHGVMDGRPRCEEGPPQVFLRADALIGEALEGGEFLHHGQHFRQVLFRRRSDHPVRARLAADTTAARDASRMEESSPTPHHVDPSVPAHST